MSRLFEIFTSEYVRLTLKKNIKQSIKTKNVSEMVELPIMIEGFFTEEDDTYYYLGYEPGSISIAVSQYEVSTMEICDPNEQLAENLNDLVETPENDNGMN